MKLIIIFGPPYSGKGTQGKLVAQKLNYVHISTGDALRSEKQQNTELGNMAQEYSKKGLLVPDNLLEIIVDRAF
ncbi:MAG TPA: nucleoside monophosphate kinase, partial [Chitinophagaceae bacterium]|nr:nucleoside monophosphate kinase [Chitinophagaceae bacterium]